MILLDHPYVSQFLIDTIRQHHIPTISTTAARALTGDADLPWVDTATAVAAASNGDFRLYTSSENALGWVNAHLADTTLPSQVAQFKDKARFRDLLADLYPDLHYQRATLTELVSLPVESLHFPLVVKPVAGFFSIGVHIVMHASDWLATLTAIRREFGAAHALFPPAVLDSTAFIIESYIPGDEYAVDAYIDDAGEPVILNILRHAFSSEADVSDRIYTSSRAVITAHHDAVQRFLGTVAQRAGLRRFPLHLEFRQHTDRLVPIELNPLRFGGWCTTADLTAYGWGFNPYLAFLNDERPDWPTLFAGKDDVAYSLVILDNSTGLPADAITTFDYDALLARFSKPLTLRRLDHRRFPVFGFLFVETNTQTQAELDYILHSDLREFCS